MKIVDYKILRTRYPMDLSADVQAEMSQGWHPLGGVSSDENGHAQAMVKYESEKDQDKVKSIDTMEFSRVKDEPTRAVSHIPIAFGYSESLKDQLGYFMRPDEDSNDIASTVYGLIKSGVDFSIKPTIMEDGEIVAFNLIPTALVNIEKL